MTMNCPQCNTVATEGSAFCEECGTSLAGAVASSDPSLRCECGAGPTAIDADGFCTQCGARRVRAPRDHFEEILSVRAAGTSDIGCKYDENQDYFVMATGPEGQIVAVVCDGVSRSQNSMVGSKMACEAALDRIKDLLPEASDDPNGVLLQAMTSAQEAICRVPFVPNLVEDGEIIPPAQATAVGVLVVGKRITLGWLGDSRAYWVGKGAARQLTVDHSWLNDVVASGQMTEEEAKKDPRARAIVRSLGADNDGANPGVVPDATTLNLTESGILLIVSDGFYTYADEREIAQLVREKGRDADALSLSRHLVEHARNSGGSDNITVVAIVF